ncbi:hypothetical protein [Pedobacter nanyangensis]|uniref:hypothetical protein n=1 Tax=Pedobacter nanyangensis TaxID=1562389 RepID=UPI000DE3E66E|nr:hypothetical protein [Pedobacter nanyangensis]
MSFSREELKIRDFDAQQKIAQALVDKLEQNQKLTAAEASHICGRLRLFHDEQGRELDALKYPQCNDCVFRDKYLLYFNNHEGWNLALDFNGEISQNHKRDDVEFLNSHHLSWEMDVVSNLRLKDEIKRHIAIETNRQIKSLKVYCQQMGYGSNRFEYLRKGLVLHSKFIYLTVLEYYDEGNPKEEILSICNYKFVIDSFVYIHVLFRHYAQIVKEHQTDKSYHSIRHFDHTNLPKEILKILVEFSGIVDCNRFDREKVFFKIDDTNFALWYKEIEFNKRGKPKEKVMQIQTLYPVEAKRDLEKIQGLNSVKVDDNLWFYL